jgi:putative ABC transport system permease protein
MKTVINDLRVGSRVLAKDLALVFVAVVCLAVGIGVNSATYSVLDAVAIRRLPFGDPDRLVSLRAFQESVGLARERVSYPDFLDWKERTHVFTDVAAVTNRSMTLSDGGEAEWFLGANVSANLFALIGAEPVLGRSFRSEEDHSGGPAVVVLGYSVWQRRYASDPLVIGRTVILNNVPHTVIGVMAPQFQFPQSAQIWTALAPAEVGSTRTSRHLQVFARLKSDSSLSDASRDISLVARTLAREVREDDGWNASAVSLRDELVASDVLSFASAMMAGGFLVLFVACANVANLLLVRAIGRRRDLAVQMALGCPRGRLVRQLVIEGLLIAGPAIPLAIVVASLSLKWLTSSIPPPEQVAYLSQAPYYINWNMNVRTLIYGVLIGLLTGVLCGVVPAVTVTSGNLNDVLKNMARTGRNRTGERVRHALVAAEVALSVVVLVSAALFVDSLVNIRGADTGFDIDKLLTMRVLMTGDEYAKTEAVIHRVEDIIRRVEALPGVDAAMASNMVPFGSGGSRGGVIAQSTNPSPGQEPLMYYFGVTPHVLKTLHVPLTSGRDFTESEGTDRSGVAIVNKAFARRLWPGLSDVLGQKFRFRGRPQDQWLTVIGIVDNFALSSALDQGPTPYTFVPYPYDPTRNVGLSLRVATNAPESLLRRVRTEVRSADPSLPVFSVQTGESARRNTFWQFQMFSSMLAAFGLAVLLLTSIGVFGAVSYSVSQRTQEIGVRIALGATAQNVFSLIVASTARVVVVGTIAGGVASMAAVRVLRSVLFNVGPADAFSVGGAALALAVVIGIAVFIPTRRAVGMVPATALRME